MVRNKLTVIFGVVLAMLGASFAPAKQGSSYLSWGNLCIDPTSTTTTLTSYFALGVGTNLFATVVGESGAYYAFGADAASCFGTSNGPYGDSTGSTTPNIAGGFSLYAGSYYDENGNVNTQRGSVQTSYDDGMLLNFGAPENPANPWSYACIRVDGTNTAFGNGTLGTYFVGASQRYLYIQYTVGQVLATLRVDVVGDAARYQWTLKNQDTQSHNIGLWLGQFTALMVQTPTKFSKTASIAGITSYYNGEAGYLRNYATKPIYVTMPNQVPPVVETRLKRADDPANFPSYVNFLFSQNIPYGLRVEAGPLDTNVFDDIVHDSTSTKNGNESDNRGADELVIGTEHYLLGGPITASTMPDVTFPEIFPGAGISDIDYRKDAGYILKYQDTNSSVAAGDDRVLVQYFRTNWSVADYRLPYATVVDAPKLITPSTTNTQTLTPNPAQVRVYVDNTVGYGGYLTGVALNTVKVTLRFPSSTGLAFSAADGGLESVQTFQGVSQKVRTASKTISNINPRRMGSVDFFLTPDATIAGTLPYEVTIEPSPGPTRTLTGSIYASPTPKLSFKAGANLVTVPWSFSDNSWTSVLNVAPGTYTVYGWDPAQKGYLPATSTARGVGQWVIAGSDLSATALSSNPVIPSDTATGFQNALVQTGWNLIGNPYSYPIKLGEIVGVSGGASDTSFAWKDLVNQNLVSGTLAYWDSNSQTYQYIQGQDAQLLPQVGYWLYVPTQQSLTLKYPAVYYEGIPVSTSRQTAAWNQDTKRWRLNLVGSSANSVDSSNFIGQTLSTSEAKQLSALKPPTSPVQDVAVSIEQVSNGQTSRMAQAYSAQAVTSYKALVYTPKSVGRVKLTWPNISQVSKNLSFRLVDVATGQTRDMRLTSGYDFDSKVETTREFQIQVGSATPSRAIIGNVVATRQGRDRNSAFAITYTLSGDATTSVRILSSNGAEVFTISSGRAEKSGDNTVTWNLKDNANRSVAPGSYKIEVLAEASNGERSRRLIPINVVR